jgi:hypothetical protein
LLTFPAASVSVAVLRAPSSFRSKSLLGTNAFREAEGTVSLLERGSFALRLVSDAPRRRGSGGGGEEVGSADPRAAAEAVDATRGGLGAVRL